MIAEIEGLLRGDSLRRLWEALDETRQLAVREALDTPVGFFDRHHFELKYRRLPAGFEDDGGLSTATLLHFFLYAPRRHGAAPTAPPTGRSSKAGTPSACCSSTPPPWA